MIIRNVLPRSQALDHKSALRDYIAANSSRGLRAFPHSSPAVYELYFSREQVRVRSHSNVLATQTFLQSLWHSSDPSTEISTRYPLSYCDRLRIREPGDAGFALSPHIDGGSLERWENPEYAGVYRKILAGTWESYDPFDATGREKAVMDMYNGAGACGMFRMWQGWMSMSDTSPGEGTLRINPMLKLASAYFMLRPFFNLQKTQPSFSADSDFPGAYYGQAQELRDKTHPHLLADSMVSIPKVEPGDYVAWHCDTIHAVDPTHNGKGDSSVMYIPAAPLCRTNVEYLVRQRSKALGYAVPPDFPGGDEENIGEMVFVDKVCWETDVGSDEGRRAMGMGTRGWEVEDDMGSGEKVVIDNANRVVFG